MRTLKKLASGTSAMLCLNRTIPSLLIMLTFFCCNAFSGSELYFIHNDHLNTPQALTNGNQDLTWKVVNQSPFGELEINDDVDGNGERIEFNIRFPGQYFDVESGTSYNYYRTYDPSLGRYVQSDPIGLAGGINTYAYVENNPLIYIDPFGLAPCPPGMVPPGTPCRISRGGDDQDSPFSKNFNNGDSSAFPPEHNDENQKEIRECAIEKAKSACPPSVPGSMRFMPFAIVSKVGCYEVQKQKCKEERENNYCPVD